MKRTKRLEIAQTNVARVAESIMVDTATWQRPELSASGGETWATVATISCRIQPADLSSGPAALDLFNQVGEVKISISDTVAIAVGDRLVINGDTYNVTAVANLSTWGATRTVTGVLVTPYGEVSP